MSVGLRQFLGWLKAVHWWRVGFVLAGLALVSVAVQLLMPVRRTTPHTRVGDIDMVSMTVPEVEQTLQNFQNSAYINLKIGEEVFVKKYSEIGIELDLAQAERATNYSLKQRLVPFSSAYRYLAKRNLEIAYQINEQKARAAIEELASTTSYDPEPAAIRAQGATVEVVPEIKGVKLDVDHCLRLLQQIVYRDRFELDLQPERIDSSITTDQATVIADQANTYINRRITLTADSRQVVIPAETMASWFYVQSSEGEPRLAFDEAKVNEYLDEVAAELHLPATNTTITLRDGKEVSHVRGVAGLVINKEVTLGELKSLLGGNGEGNQVALQFVEVEPQVKYHYTYSPNTSGLAAFLGNLSRSSGDYRISVTALDKDASASYRGDEVVPAASTYKVYVAYHLFKQVEAGQVAWGHILPSGRSVDSCLEQMIVISSNSCAHELRDFLGADNINASLRAIGLPAAGFRTGAAVTSASEMTRFLVMLATDQLVSATHRDRMLDMMFRQIHRNAIPVGVYPAKVADKGGFYGSYNHDTGIVYGNKGRYAVTLLATGVSKSGLASVARQIHQFMEGL